MDADNKVFEKIKNAWMHSEVLCWFQVRSTVNMGHLTCRNAVGVIVSSTYCVTTSDNNAGKPG